MKILQCVISKVVGRGPSTDFPFSSILPKIILPLAVCKTLVTEISTVRPIILRESPGAVGAGVSRPGRMIVVPRAGGEVACWA